MGKPIYEGKLPVKPAANMDYFKDYDRKRKAAELSDSDVCAAAGVANSTISRARQQGAEMTRRTYDALCKGIDTILRRRLLAMRRAGLATGRPA
jgi:hypothetical protein